MGVFFDDAVRVNDRLTLNLGLRYDHTPPGPRAHGPRPAGEPRPETRSPPATLDTWNVASPRFGFNLKLTGDGKTALEATAAAITGGW